MAERVLILPGWHGSGPEHWQRQLARSVPNALVVEQADWARPDLDAWLDRLVRALAATPGPAILVAHSLGVILAAHHAARSGGRSVACALLVAPGDADLHAASEPDIAGFAPIPRGALPYPSILIASRTDPYMSLARSRELADDFGSEFVDLGDAGHINVAGGFGPWPAAAGFLRRLRAQLASSSIGEKTT